MALVLALAVLAVSVDGVAGMEQLAGGALGHPLAGNPFAEAIALYVCAVSVSKMDTRMCVHALN